ncbi:MAG: decarboxylating 6-phosphogluconate dehydrogenase [Nitrosarchaeum sp.]|nr:decarboxylating 6-phosphogluconate dehydrogenase [Nitrosarchaeum sp.]
MGSMRAGFIGLGRMGASMVRHLLEQGTEVVVYNRDPAKMRPLVRAGALMARDVEDVLMQLPRSRIVWLMVKAGAPVDELLDALLVHLRKGDVVIDGGNSFYKDSQRRYERLRSKGVSFLDVGTSGGMEGARHGACMMVGGDKAVFAKLKWLFKAMCVHDGFGYLGGPGAGHFAKMVHNGIEYGMMAAIGEGLQAIKEQESSFGFDLKEVTKVYAHGSIIESRLMSWTLRSYAQKGYLDGISGSVPKGETEEEMRALASLATMPVLEAALRMREDSRTAPTYAGQLVSAMRNQFGGHAVNRR